MWLSYRNYTAPSGHFPSGRKNECTFWVEITKKSVYNHIVTIFITNFCSSYWPGLTVFHTKTYFLQYNPSELIFIQFNCSLNNQMLGVVVGVLFFLNNHNWLMWAEIDVLLIYLWEAESCVTACGCVTQRSQTGRTIPNNVELPAGCILAETDGTEHCKHIGAH